MRTLMVTGLLIAVAGAPSAEQGLGPQPDRAAARHVTVSDVRLERAATGSYWVRGTVRNSGALVLDGVYPRVWASFHGPDGALLFEDYDYLATALPIGQRRGFEILLLAPRRGRLGVLPARVHRRGAAAGALRGLQHAAPVARPMRTTTSAGVLAAVLAGCWRSLSPGSFADRAAGRDPAADPSRPPPERDPPPPHAAGAAARGRLLPALDGPPHRRGGHAGRAAPHRRDPAVHRPHPGGRRAAGEHVTVANVRLEASGPGTFHYVKGTIRNSGSTSFSGFPKVWARFYTAADLLVAQDFDYVRPAATFAVGAQQPFSILLETSDTRGWAYYRLAFTVDDERPVRCAGCGERRREP